MRLLLLVLLNTTLLGAAACGGKVVVDGEAPIGTGGTTSGSSSGSTSSQAPTSTGSGSQDPLCTPLCEAVVAGGCAGNDCVAQCAKTLAAVPKCHDAAQAAATCIEAHAADFPGCTTHPCDLLMSDYLDCAVKPKCLAGVVGNGNPGECIGKGNCANGAHEWITECDEAGACRCEIDSTVIGTCQETGPFLCDFMWGCCEPFFLPLQ